MRELEIERGGGVDEEREEREGKKRERGKEERGERESKKEIIIMKV